MSSRKSPAPESTGWPKPGFPGWVYPTSGAKKLHFFAEMGQPSSCRQYFAGSMELMEWPGESREPIEARCCATCWKKSGGSK